MADYDGMGMFIHATLQELRVLTDFWDKMIENHYLVRDLHGVTFVQHLRPKVGVGFDQV